ncbi:MAG: hypothetical protein HOK80_06505, partial [Candidatus Cloacimonetes bacterium]|jgi:hypothetical protein|nr:hypothetical protein [Candidatus Cloacimonadota bacterium]MBT5990188.1 hypothetical protein [Bacteroidota bacterium]MBT7995266.1 hypothetical protein [Bacteroidota bacterium]
MDTKTSFTFESIEAQFSEAIKQGYHIITCAEFHQRKKSGTLEPKTLINRIDVDFSIKKAEKIGEFMNRLRIKASFFIRLHAPEYNPFSFENYRIIKYLIESGHEIGYHSEVIDESEIWNEDAEECLKRDIDIINKIFNIKILGTAGHGGMTEFNNLDFWINRKPEDFGLLYEAYSWMNDTFYISDSEWIRWKCYDKGNLRKGDIRSLGEHAKDNHEIIYSLIHPASYFNNHFYE